MNRLWTFSVAFIRVLWQHCLCGYHQELPLKDLRPTAAFFSQLILLLSATLSCLAWCLAWSASSASRRLWKTAPPSRSMCTPILLSEKSMGRDGEAKPFNYVVYTGEDISSSQNLQKWQYWNTEVWEFDASEQNWSTVAVGIQTNPDSVYIQQHKRSFFPLKWIQSYSNEDWRIV